MQYIAFAIYRDKKRSSLVLDHWSNDAMVSIDRCGLTCELRDIFQLWAEAEESKGDWELVKEKPNQHLEALKRGHNVRCCTMYVIVQCIVY